MSRYFMSMEFAKFLVYSSIPVSFIFLCPRDLPKRIVEYVDIVPLPGGEKNLRMDTKDLPSRAAWNAHGAEKGGESESLEEK